MSRILLAEVSSRSLGLVRVMVALTIYTEFASPWVTHRMDDHAGTLLLSVAMFIAATFVVFGYKTKHATIILATTFAALHLYYGVELGIAKLRDPVAEFQLVVLLAVTPCGRSLSIDRALAVRRARAEGRAPAPERVPWWQLELFVVLIASRHLWMAIDCSNEAWLSGAWIEHDLIRLWASSDLLVWRPWVHPFAVAIAWTVTVACYLLALGLVVRRWRPTLVWLAVAIQFAVLFSFVSSYASSYYNLVVLATLIACLDPERVHAFISIQGDPVERTPEVR